jgi:predicted DNA-binding transcriptional regulator AlpA
LSETLLNARQVAERLGLSPSTVLDRFESGDLPGFKLYGRRGGPVRFRWSEIEAALERWRSGAAPGRGMRQHTPSGAANGIMPLANTPDRRERAGRDEEDD